MTVSRCISDFRVGNNLDKNREVTSPFNIGPVATVIKKVSEHDQEIHNHMQTNPWHREEEPQYNNGHKTSERKYSNRVSLPHQDDCKTRKDTNYCITKQGTNTLVVMDVTLAPTIFKPEKILVFFQDKIVGARDEYPGKLEWLAVNI